MMTGNVDNRNRGGQRPAVGLVGLVEDLWVNIMILLSLSDVVRLSLTCKTLYKYSQCHLVWHSALVKHYFLPKSYTHLLYAPTSVIQHQLSTTARLDAAFSQNTLKPIRSYSFPLDIPELFQGLRFLPGSDWLVLLFHSWTLNPARHSNICLFKPPMMASRTTDTKPASVMFQSEWCWKHLNRRSGPYKSSRGDDLMFLKAFGTTEHRFAVCHLDTRTPSVKITFMIHTTLRLRNFIAAGDYLVYGWINNDRKHMVRIMKLSDDYTKLAKDVIAEIDSPRGTVGRWMLHYDLRLSGKQPRLLLITTRLMAAYDISDDVLTSGCQSSPLKLQTVWKYLPEKNSFGRILHVLHESAVVTLYERKVKFIYPEMDNQEPDAKTVATYSFPSLTPYSTEDPVIFTSQRMFWLLSFPHSLPASTGPKYPIEAAIVPAPSNTECKIDRILIDHDELTPVRGSLRCTGLHWDELSGRLCVRYMRSGFPHDRSRAKADGRVIILEMV